MGEIQEFLTAHFLQRRDRRKPDGRLLYRYECQDQEFWHLVDLLRKCGPLGMRHFNEIRSEFHGHYEERVERDDSLNYIPDEFDWTVRGFVLYASEFWLRFMNENWRQSSLPEHLPFRRLTWLQFLSLVEWTSLYGQKVEGYIEIFASGTRYRLAHSSKRYANRVQQASPAEEAVRSAQESKNDTGHYSDLYDPIRAAWDWWGVAPVRLPSSVRYLDTFAHQGGAGDRLVVECKLDPSNNSPQFAYIPVKPLGGHGIKVIHIDRQDLPRGADPSELNVTLLFGQHDGPGAV